mgnify:CR=1 FL=1|tara:strand:- start:3673 stop:5487 length:1815 start_codon:yes stop_codon:yes gene_type:complete
MTLLRNNALWLGAIALLLLGAYYPVIFSEYGFTDDYYAITLHKTVGPWDFKTLYTVLGRPICSVLTGYAFAPVETISDLAYVRAISVITLAITGMSAFLILRNFRISESCALLVAAVLTLNPAAGVFAGWAATFIYPLSVLISLIGGWFIIRGLEDCRWRTATAGFACLLVSFFIYQPTALACLVLFAVHYYTPRDKAEKPPFLQWSASIAITSVAMVVYYILYKSYLPLLEQYGMTTDRGGIVTEIGDKLAYYFKGPLWESILWWAYYAPKWVGWGILSMLISATLYLVFGHAKRSGWLSSSILTALLLATLLLASSPIIVPHQNDHQLRVFYPLIVLLGAIYAIAFGQLTQRLSGWLKLALPLFIVILLSLLSHHYVNEGIVKPHTNEVQAYKSYLEENLQAPPEFAFFIHPILAKEDVSSLGAFHEYGRYSSWLPWVPHSLINILLWEQDPLRMEQLQEAEIIQVYPWQIHHFPEGAVVLDGYYIQANTRTPPYKAYKNNMLAGFVPDAVENPLFGTTETLNRDWFFALNFGFFKSLGDNAYQFFDYGTYAIEPIDSPEGSIEMIDEKGQRLITSEAHFPSVYDPVTNTHFQLTQKIFSTL